MDDELDDMKPRRWPVRLALVATLAWLVAAALGAAQLSGAVELPTNILLLASMLVPLLAPLAVLWLVVVQMREAGAIAAANARLAATRTAIAAERVERGGQAVAALESRVDNLYGALATIADNVASQHQALDAAIARIEGAAGQLASTTRGTEGAVQQFAGAVPAAQAQADALIELLGRAENQIKGQLAETETLLASLYTRASEAETEARTAMTRVKQGLAAIEEAAVRARDQVAQPVEELTSAVDTAFNRTTQAVDSTRNAVHAQTNALLASVEQARVTLDQIGGEASRTLQEQLEMLLGLTGQIADQLNSEAGRAQLFVNDVSSGFGLLGSRLAEASNAAQAAIDGIDARLASTRSSMDGLGDPLARAEAAVVVVESRVADMALATDRALASLFERLPEAAPQLDEMTNRLAALGEQASAIVEPMSLGANAITSSQDRLEMARQALDAAASDMTATLGNAQALVQQIEASTSTVALAASTDLVEAFNRVRDIAQATAGTMRGTLAGVITEAEEALDKAGTERAERAFAMPVRAKLAELADAQDRAAAAAQAAAERIAQRLLGLTRTVLEVESHVEAVETRALVRARNTLDKRANALIGALQSSAVDMAQLLDFDIDDKTWDDFAAGDRSAIARRLASGLDRGTGRSFISHYQHDPSFRQEAARYMADFEALIAEMVPERKGDALGATLLSSTLGKLYLALAQAAGRLN